MLWQGDKIIFDTGDWKTRREVHTILTYDRFVVEWGPDKETTFQFVPQD